MAIELPLLAFRFVMEWGGERLGFTEISGTTNFTTEVVKYREGDMLNQFELTRPGRRTFDGTIECKRGIIAGDSGFMDWLFTNSNGEVERRDLQISVLDADNNPVVTWKVNRAWPKSLESASLNSTSNEHMIETLSIEYDSIEQEFVA